MAFIPFFIAKDRKKFVIGMGNRQSDGFFGSLIKSPVFLKLAIKS
jgi:hypothetical protein